ncbi:hypothetical protein BDW69DRAFT_170549 [Aspergillus filifer]
MRLSRCQECRVFLGLRASCSYFCRKLIRGCMRIRIVKYLCSTCCLAVTLVAALAFSMAVVRVDIEWGCRNWVYRGG